MQRTKQYQAMKVSKDAATIEVDPHLIKSDFCKCVHSTNLVRVKQCEYVSSCLLVGRIQTQKEETDIYLSNLLSFSSVSGGFNDFESICISSADEFSTSIS